MARATSGRRQAAASWEDTSIRKHLFRSVAMISALSIAVPPPSFAQAPAPPAVPAVQTAVPSAEQDAAATLYTTAQLDALLAPIALYPDTLLVQVLMASTYPLQVVDAARWRDQPANKNLSGDALAKALEPQSWDPSVKSVVPFPQVLAMMNSQLDWMQQVGYAFSTQQGDVMDSVQRLRLQAQQAGSLKTTEQQKVIVQEKTIIIEPAQPQVVYVPTYNPAQAYGTWPYPAYPPVYIPPPPGYAVANALVAGMAFATGVAVVGSLWGWARPTWYGGSCCGYGHYGGSVNVNVNRYNNINVNRAQIHNSTWRPPAPGVGGRPMRPPNGPVGRPSRPGQLPANAVGRPSVKVSGDLVNRPGPGNGGANRPGGAGGGPNGGANRPGQGGNGGIASGGNRPGGGGNGVGGNRPNAGGNGGGGANRPQTRPQRPPQQARPAPAQRPSGAFNGVSQGARASQFGNRGAQSRESAPRGGGGGRMGGGGSGGRAGGRPHRG